MQIHGALLALHTNVRSRSSTTARSRSSPHPPASREDLGEHRASSDGRLVNVRVRILLDGGAYASSSTAVTSNAASFAVGPYAVDNALIESTCVYTNNPPCGAMRGFGAVQVCFAHEAQMDKLAEALDIDPIELRLLNALGPGGSLPTGQKITDTSGSGCHSPRSRARRSEAEELPRDPMRLPGGSGNTTRGEGSGAESASRSASKNIGYSEGFDDYTAARVQLHADGSATVHCAAAEVGQGVANVILQVARTELGVRDVVLAPHTTRPSIPPAPLRLPG